MTGRIHPLAGAAGLALIAVFFTSTVLVESFGGHGSVALVKRWILYGIVPLVPLMAAAGITGARLAAGRGGGLAGRKKMRMPFIAANGLLVLIPCAVFLDRLASSGDFGGIFYAVQAVELLAGSVNITLMALNLRDGFRLGRAA